MEQTVAWIVVAITVVSALGLGYRQLRVRQWLQQNEVSLSSADIAYHRWSIRRRLAGCALLLILAGMIAGLYVFQIAQRLDELQTAGEQFKGTGQKLTAEQEAFLLNSLRYVAVLLIILMVLFFLAGWDIIAIRRFGFRHRQRIRDDRRAMLERQLPLLYAERRVAQDADRPSTGEAG